MSGRTTRRLLVAVLLLGALIWYMETRVEPLRIRRMRRLQVFELPSEAVTFLSVAWQGQRVDCEREREDRWMLRWPMTAPAAAGRIAKILASLEALQCEETIDAAQREARDLTLADYGLADPRYRIVAGDNLLRYTLNVGTNAPLGSLVYVMLEGRDDVLAVSDAFLAALPDSVADLRDRTLVHGDPARVNRIELERDGLGFIQLVRSGKTWRIVQPVLFRADSRWVGRLLNAFFETRIQSFEWDPALNPADAAVGGGLTAPLEPYGLAADASATRMAVWMRGDQVGREVAFGDPVKDTGWVYARNRAYDSVYAVDSTVREMLNVTLNDIRDKSIANCAPQDVQRLQMTEGDRRLILAWDATGGWTIEAPVQWKADDRAVSEVAARLTALEAAAFLGPQATNLAAIGLDPPQRSIAWAVADKTPIGDATADPASCDAGVTGTVHRLLVGNRVAEESQFYAKLAASPCLFVLDASDVEDWMTAGLADPLRYKDRLMLSVGRESVRRIQLRRGDTEQRVLRSGESDWAPESPDGGTVRTNHVHEILFAVANLRALRVESHVPKSLVAFGLDQPAAALTLGLSGEQGIRKTIHLGYRSRTDGVYAMVQGQDVVFVLGTPVAELLTQDLVLPTAQED